MNVKIEPGAGPVSYHEKAGHTGESGWVYLNTKGKES